MAFATATPAASDHYASDAVCAAQTAKLGPGRVMLAARAATPPKHRPLPVSLASVALDPALPHECTCTRLDYLIRASHSRASSHGRTGGRARH